MKTEIIKAKLETLESLNYIHVTINGSQKSFIPMDEVIKAMLPLKIELNKKGLVYFKGKLIKLKHSRSL